MIYKILIFLIIFIIVDYYIIKKYKNYIVNKEINHIIEIIKNNYSNYNEINDKIDLLSVNKKREDILKKIVNILINNKNNELKPIMISNIKQESEITSNNVKKHLTIYKNDLCDYKKYLRDFVKSLNETKEINIIISQV
jgi:hypothetical protein